MTAFGQQPEEVEDEISDEESVIETKKKNSSSNQVVKEFPTDLQNNFDAFITPVMMNNFILFQST